MDTILDPMFAQFMSYASGLFAAFTVATVLMRKASYSIPAYDVNKGHRWYDPDTEDTLYCNVCKELMREVRHCECCGIYADPDCVSVANYKFQCKALSWTGSNFGHQWVQANLNERDKCNFCHKFLGNEPFESERCCWCQRVVHTECENNLMKNCDFGFLQDFIVPPTSIRLRLVGWQGRRHWVVREVLPFTNNNTLMPLIVIGNRKSGNSDGPKILRRFRQYLNPIQVIDLEELPVESALEWCKMIPDRPCRFLIVGGDGTITWVLNTIDNYQLVHRPLVAVLPVGTGNDLSRVLRWGCSVHWCFNIIEFFQKLQKSEQVTIDRWKIEIRSLGQLGLLLPSKVVYATNYYSIGVDALILLKFHQTRHSKFYPFCSRALNKMLFVGYATKDVVEHQCKDLHHCVSLSLDDVCIQLPELEAILFLNIPSYGAGCDIWELGEGREDWSEQSISDGKIEVIGIVSSFHLGQMQLGLSEPIRLGQAKTAKIIVKDVVPMQVDGEPWEQTSCEVNLTYHSQSLMLRATLEES